MTSIASPPQPGKPLAPRDRLLFVCETTAARIRRGDSLQNHELLDIARVALDVIGGRRALPTVDGRLSPLLPDDCSVVTVRCPRCDAENQHLWSHDLPIDGPRHRTAHCGCWPDGYVVTPRAEAAAK